MKGVNHFFSMIAVTLIATSWCGPRLLSSDIRGRVTDLRGSPLAQADVEVSFDNIADKVHLGDKVLVLTDQAGNYHVSELAEGDFTVIVKFRGFEQEKKKVSLGAAEHHVLDFGLVVGKWADYAPGQVGPSVEVDGTVRTVNNAPASDATVTVVSPFNQRVFRQSRTDEKGHFNIKLYDGAQFLVYAFKPDFKVSSTIVVVTRLVEQRLTVDLVLEPLLLDDKRNGR